MHTQSVITNCVHSTDDLPLMLHHHNSHEVVYVRSGRATFVINNKPYSVGANTLVFINSFEDHTVTITEYPYSRYFMLFTSEQLNQMVHSPQLKSFIVRHDNSFSHTMSIDPYKDEIDYIFKQIHHEFYHNHLFSTNYISSYFQQLLILCHRSNDLNKDAQMNALNPAVFKLQSYIDENYTENLSVSKICADYYLSESYLSHAFKTWTGLSPQQYITASRLAFAKQLLSTTTDSVTEISNQCGFSSVHYFIQVFKKDTKQTPKQFRNALSKQPLYF